MSELDDLLAQARDADPGDRIKLRDSIAAHGDAAIDAMIDWVGDQRLAAFAIRVLERIGMQSPHRSAVVDVLAAVDGTELSSHVLADLEGALASLGVGARSARTPRGASATSSARPPGIPGTPGRGYWVMRTSPWDRPFLWAEAQEGRLRQGWGRFEDQNLEVIATAIRRGDRLSDTQAEARRALRMLTSWEGGMRVGDVVVAPNMPEYGRLSVFRVIDSYVWSPTPPRQFSEQFGHVLPVEPLATDVNRWGPDVSDGLRAILGVQTRLYNISGYGGDVERLIGGDVPTDRRGDIWTEAEYETLFGQFPPDGPRPTDAQVDALVLEFGRTRDAISWQWADGAAHVQGGSASTTSEPLRAWLDGREFRR